MQRLIGTALAWGLLAGAAAAQTTLSPQEARVAAAQLLVSGQAQAAADIAAVLVERDTADVTGLLIHAQAMRTLGRHGEAQRSARAAWRGASNDQDRYGAALTMAQTLSSDGHKMRAQFWLRRAADVAPTPALRARAARDFGFVRKTNPLSVSLSFGITPSSNVNNAPRDNTIVLGGLVFTDPSAVPISGVELRSDVALRYTLNQSQTWRNFVGLRWSEAHVIFTDNDVPAGVRASDYAFRRIEATVGRDFTRGPEAPRQTVSASFGRLWAGGDALADEFSLAWSQSYARPNNQRFTWSASVGYSDRKDNALRSGVTADLSARWLRPLGSGSVLAWDAALGRTVTDSKAVTRSTAGFGVQYHHASPILGGKGQLALASSLSDYDDPLYGPDARQDIKTTLSASLLMVNFDTYGFAPKLTVEASKTSSNINRFETQNFGIRLGVQSLF